MKIITTWITGLFVLAPAVLSGQLGVPADQPSIRTVGVATRAVPPDRAYLFLELRGEGPSPDVAALAVAALRGRAEEALASAGVAPEAVSPFGMAVGEARGIMGPRGPSTEAPGSEAKTGLRVVADPRRVEEIAAAALGVPGVVLRGVYYAAEGHEDVRSELLAEAVRSARADAEAMVAASGAELGPLIFLGMDTDFTAFALQERVMQQGSYPGQGVSLTPHSVQVRVSISAVWMLFER